MLHFCRDVLQDHFCKTRTKTDQKCSFGTSRPKPIDHNAACVCVMRDIDIVVEGTTVGLTWWPNVTSAVTHHHHETTTGKPAAATNQTLTSTLDLLTAASKGIAGSKTLHQQNPPVLNRRCRLMLVDLYTGRKTVAVVVGCVTVGPEFMRPTCHAAVPAAISQRGTFNKFQDCSSY